MAGRDAFTDIWHVDATQLDYQVKFSRGNAQRAEIVLTNLGNVAVQYNISGIYMVPHDSLLRDIAMVNPYPWGAINAMGPPTQFFPINETSGTVLGNQGGTGQPGTILSGSISTTVHPGDIDEQPDLNSVVNAVVRTATTAILSSLTTWTISGVLQTASISNATINIFYSETNAASTHFLQAYMDTDGRLAVKASNGGAAVVAKNAAGPIMTTGSFHWFTIVNRNGNVSFMVDGNDGGTVAATLPTFVDANLSEFGTITGWTGWMGYQAYYQTKQATLAWHQWQGFRNFFSYLIGGLGSGTIASNGTVTSVLGEGSSNPLPETLVIDFHNNTGETYGGFACTLIEGDT